MQCIIDLNLEVYPIGLKYVTNDWLTSDDDDLWHEGSCVKIIIVIWQCLLQYTTQYHNNATFCFRFLGAHCKIKRKFDVEKGA